jgi:hypothetical protein
MVLLFAACGDNTHEGDDTATIDAAVPDAGAPDAAACPARGFGEVGGGCALNADCDTS